METKPYRRTLSDRLGPLAFEYQRAAIFGFAIFVFMLVVTSHHGAFVSFAVSLAAGTLTTGLGLAMGHTAGATWQAIAVDGASTPYEQQYSYEQSLVMQGRTDDALASFEQIIASQPDAPRPRVLAAELYAKSAGGAARAAELFLEARAVPAVDARDDIYIANRLVDLYLGPLENTGAAMRELRRLIDRHANTPAARHARETLRELKARDRTE